MEEKYFVDNLYPIVPQTKTQKFCGVGEGEDLCDKNQEFNFGHVKFRILLDIQGVMSSRQSGISRSSRLEAFILESSAWRQD